MTITKGNVTVGTELPPLVKHMTQEKMNIFSGGAPTPTRPGGIHTSADAARLHLGMERPIASGRMSLGYATESLRRFFGAEVFNHSGTVDLKFVNPVLDGDTVTVKGKVTETKPEGEAIRVTLDIWCENQKGERTAVGAGSVLLPR